MIKRVKVDILFIVFLMVGLMLAMKSQAQQISYYSMYVMNNYLLNPAAGGLSDHFDVKASTRYQWVGIDGAPSSSYITANFALGKIHESTLKSVKKTPKTGFHTLGIKFTNESQGAISYNGIYASYGYNLHLTKTMNISMGAFLGLRQFGLNSSKFEAYNANSSLNAGYSLFVPDASVGIWLYDKSYFLGLSVAQLFQSNISNTTQQDNQSRLFLHYFATAGYRFKLSEKAELMPSVLVKYMYPLPVSIDINARVKYDDKYWGGLSFRNLNSFTLYGGILILDAYEVGFSYDTGYRGIGSMSYGTYEILLGVRLDKVKLSGKKETHSPSDFWD